MKTIILKDRIIKYVHRRLLRSRRIRLAVSADQKLTVTTPVFFPEHKVKEFLLFHADWILEKINYHQQRSSKSIFPSHPKDYLINKSRALRLVREKITKLNSVYGFRYNKVTIKNTSSRWGSCSKSGNLNFNYKLIYLPDQLAEYVVAHELCHLQEMNHGVRFWRLVVRTIPDWKIVRRQLKNIF